MSGLAWGVILLGIIAVLSVVFGGVGALSAVLIVAAIAAGIYLFMHTRTA